MIEILDTKKIIDGLNSSDSTIRKETLEKIEVIDIDEKISDKLCELLNDSDKGVRDAVSQLFVRIKSNLLILKLTKLISSEDIVIRNLAGEILYQVGSAAVFPLLQRLEYANENDQKFIIDLLGLISDPSAEKYIVKILKSSTNSNVILSCIEALGNIGMQSSADFVIQWYGKDEIYNATVLEALGKIGGEQVLDFMLNTFDKADYLSRYSIIESLKSIGNEKSFFFLLNKLGEFDNALLFAAIDTINTLRLRYNFDIPYDEKTRNLILTAIDSAELNYKKAALELAIQFDDKKLNDYMFKLYGTDSELDQIIYHKLIKRPVEYLLELTEYIENDVPNVNEIILLINSLVLHSFEQILEPENELLRKKIANTVSKYLLHPDEELRRICIELIFRVDYKNAFVLAESMLEDEIVWNRLRVIELLYENKFNMPSDLLAKLLNDEDEMIRKTTKQLFS
ncbi:HEAT repeat domain-containing protein [Melioribacteraceae bacterium 4301-Me]|uniref:HEAT repeat domain-containing protein n=1 Tax=Pyranulibacter aquaticus TaxID=3163344 RepID=UPI00359BEEFA